MTAETSGTTPRRKWRSIAVATVLLTFSYWFIIVASVAAKVEDGPQPGPALAVGLVIVPFVFMVLAFMSGHRSAPSGVILAMVLSTLVTVAVWALTDPVTGLVAGYGAGGILTLRWDDTTTWRSRIVGVLLGTLYVFVLLRVVTDAGLVFAPAVPLTSIGIADYINARRPTATPTG